MNKKRLLSFVAITLLLLSVLSCKSDEKSPTEQIRSVLGRFHESLGSVRFYRSDVPIGEEGYTDQGMIASLLGNGKDYPSEMAGVSEYALLCASQMEICEVWAVKCRTNSSAKKMHALFEKRRERIGKLDYESETDTVAAKNARVAIDGKYVYFAAAEDAERIIDLLLEE